MSGLVPKLRFPEFSDAPAWEQRPLGQLGRFYRGLTYAADDVAEEGLLVLRSSNIQNGNLVLDSDLVHVRKACPEELLLRPEDIAICMSNGSKALVGKSARYAGDGPEQITVGAFCSIFRPSNTFASLVFATQQYEDFVALGIAGGNINNLKNSDLEGLRFAVPPLDTEQRKIAECLTSLDELIAAEGRRLEALRKWKKALLQNLFPREGETTPRLRFPEFRDAGEWKEDRLSAHVDLISGLHLLPEQYGPAGDVPYFTGPTDFTNDLEAVAKWTSISSSTGQAHDTLITVKGSGVGQLWYLDLPSVALGRQLMAVRPRSISPQFIFQLLSIKKSRFEALASGNLIPGLSRGDILDLIALFPSPPEAGRIASCLGSLDTLITAEAKKLDALKTHKQGLMQGLFPRPGDPG